MNGLVNKDAESIIPDLSKGMSKVWFRIADILADIRTRYFVIQAMRSTVTPRLKYDLQFQHSNCSSLPFSQEAVNWFYGGADESNPKSEITFP
jgi:hypothetical protein